LRDIFINTLQYLSYYHLGALEGTIWRVMSHFYSGCIHTYVPTASVKAELEAHDVVTDGVRIWTRGVDTRLFNPSKRCPEWRTALGVEPDVPIVLLVCRLVRAVP
jgi:phosphatidylinositol alpha 1,6-mannosyltransferase